MNANLNESVGKISNFDASLKLLMYRAMPAQGDAWLSGYLAAQTNLDLEENPYTPNDDEFKAWESGWWEGFYGDHSGLHEIYESVIQNHAVRSRSQAKSKFKQKYIKQYLKLVLIGSSSLLFFLLLCYLLIPF
ncbi:MAG: hypothetical protein KBD64_03235 [Gammaproteobacteria bacterium]|nr:hypothetical protein [Gammaproteobacteria bacterium]